MKKVYSKPAIVFESFSMNTNIAGDCERIVELPTKGICGVPGSTANMNIFASDVTDPVNGCHVWNDTDEYDGFCYHVPTDKNELFNS